MLAGITTISGERRAFVAWLFCDADLNRDNTVNPDDLSDFITCFFLEVQLPGTCAQADFNTDGFTSPDDRSDYITAFFTPCP
jgi:hypothetical protein